MSQEITVRVVVKSNVFKISADQSLPNSWLMSEALRRFYEANSGRDPGITGLFNRSRKKEIFLGQDVGQSMSNHDVIEAITGPEPQGNDLERRPGIEVSNSKHTGICVSSYDGHTGLFFDQLRLFQYLGNNHRPTRQESKAAEQSSYLRNLLAVYIGCSIDVINSLDKSQNSATPIKVYRRGSKFVESVETETPEEPELVVESDSNPKTSMPSPVQAVQNPPKNDKRRDSAVCSVFDIVFSQQAIGMKLGTDDSKNHAVVKECFEGSEASRYAEIQSGVAIVAVNGENVQGIGLSRTLYKLREAKRPVVVRFGKLLSPTKSSNSLLSTFSGLAG